MVGDFWHLGVTPPPLGDPKVLRDATKSIEKIGEQAARDAIVPFNAAQQLAETRPEIQRH